MKRTDLYDVSERQTFPILVQDVSDHQNRRHVYVGMTGKIRGTNVKLAFDGEGRAYGIGSGSGLVWYRQPTNDLEADEKAVPMEPQSSNQLPDQGGFLVQVAGPGGQSDNIRVTQESERDFYTGRKTYVDAEGVRYSDNPRGSGLVRA